MLAEFLDDLDDLDSGDEDEDQQNAIGGEDGAAFDEDDPMADALADGSGGSQRPPPPAGATGLLQSTRLTQLLKKIDHASASSTAMTDAQGGGGASSSTAVVAAAAADADEEIDEAVYELIVACNEMVIDVEYEIDAIAKTVKDVYARRFPELDSLIPNPLDYARVVLKLGNEIELSEVDLTGILPSATIMVVTVTASTTIGTVLADDALANVTSSCEQVLELSSAKTSMLAFVESRMSAVAPNLSTLVGTAIAAKLIGAAGGLAKLAGLPSTVVQVLGHKRKSATGMGAGAGILHGGFLQHCDLVQNTPPALRNKVLRLVAGKGTLAARVDTYADKGGGAVGKKFRDDIEMRATKLQEPPPPKDIKPLPVPPEAAGKKRGGRRVRKAKERYGMSQMRQLTNRVQFGEEEDTGVDGTGLGMLGRAQQSGKLRVTAKEQKLLNEKNKKARLMSGGPSASSGSTSGLASSLAFTPVQGIELVNPNVQQDSREGTETYFQKSAAIFKASI